MHELSIAASVLEIALRHAAGRQILRVHLKVGSMRQVVPTALAFGFEVLSQGTLAEGAGLEMESIPAVGLCRQCGAESQLQEFPLHCEICGSFDLKIVAGEDLVVQSLELEEMESGAQ